MNILHVQLSHLPLPPLKYGGTERVVWSLYQGQRALGHEVRFLWRQATSLPENTLIYNPHQSFDEQIGNWPDIVHFHWPYEGVLAKPFVCTEHGNANAARRYPINTIFLSDKHAQNHGADFYIYNGLDWRDYGEPSLEGGQTYCHFLGKAKARSKNIQGAMEIAKRAGVELAVLGGHRINLSRNPYACWSPHVRFHGMVGGEKKYALIRNSAALIAPARWHEPFGLAIIESLYLGVPVLATPFGSLPELIDNTAVGKLSVNYDELAEAARHSDQFDRRACHELARTRFGMIAMAENYITAYQRVLDGESLNGQPPEAKQSFTDVLPIES